MKKKERISEIKITVCGNDVEVVSDSIDYRGLKMATLGLMGFVKKNIELATREIETETDSKFQEEELKNSFADMLHSWVDKACREDYEPRQDN